MEEFAEGVVQEPILLSESDFPRHVTASIRTGKGEQIVDAEVICPEEGCFTYGSLLADTYSGEESRKKLVEYGYADKMEDFWVSEEEESSPTEQLGLSNVQYFRGQNPVAWDDPETMQRGRETAEELFELFGTHDKIVREETAQWRGQKLYCFESVYEYDGLVLKGGIGEMIPRQYGEITDGKISQLTIRNYTMANQVKAEILPLDEIITAYAELLKRGTLSPTKNGTPIEKIELVYWMEEQRNGELFYCPAWDFQRACTYDESKQEAEDGGMTEEEHRDFAFYDAEHRHVLLDACTGELIVYNSDTGGE